MKTRIVVHDAVFDAADVIAVLAREDRPGVVKTLEFHLAVLRNGKPVVVAEQGEPARDIWKGIYDAKSERFGHLTRFYDWAIDLSRTRLIELMTDLRARVTFDLGDRQQAEITIAQKAADKVREHQWL